MLSICNLQNAFFGVFKGSFYISRKGPSWNGHTLSGRNGRPWKHQQKQPENVPTIPFGSQYWYCNTSCVNLETKKWIGKLLTTFNKFPSSDKHHSLRVRLLPLKSKHWRGDRKTTSRLELTDVEVGSLITYRNKAALFLTNFSSGCLECKYQILYCIVPLL